MLTTFEQVKEWITENGFKRWVLYKNDSRTEKIIDSANFTVSDMSDKLDMTEKYLRLAGGRAFAAGATTNAQSDLNTTIEIRLEQESVKGVGAEPYNSAELRESIIREVRATMELESLKKREADLDRREKELDADRKSAMGALIHYFAPIGQMLLEKRVLPRVAGVDADVPVTAQPMSVEQPAEDPETETPSAWDNFTEEEGDEIGELLARFKKVEPDYLKMLRKVVSMAEANDATYQMARNFLL